MRHGAHPLLQLSGADLHSLPLAGYQLKIFVDAENGTRFACSATEVIIVVRNHLGRFDLLLQTPVPLQLAILGSKCNCRGDAQHHNQKNYTNFTRILLRSICYIHGLFSFKKFFHFQ